MQNKHDDDDELDELRVIRFSTQQQHFEIHHSRFVRFFFWFAPLPLRSGLFHFLFSRSTVRLYYVCVCVRECVQRKARDSMVRKLFDFSHFHAKEKYQDALNWSLANAISKINCMLLYILFHFLDFSSRYMRACIYSSSMLRRDYQVTFALDLNIIYW